ncbi:MAG: hypothetical protein IPK17_20245 [Chloroflexi bacterium]|uniref:hypothetical protein n=1 Tax=Candidatus Flexifilum breve TaxID=3140694 RepID=UPI003137408C|nr:hypothetical protein [Chloroflexota bacterium]
MSYTTKNNVFSNGFSEVNRDDEQHTSEHAAAHGFSLCPQDKMYSAEVSGLSISSIAFKVATPDLLILENTFHRPVDQRGICTRRTNGTTRWKNSFLPWSGTADAQAGDSVLAPPDVPHVWSVGEQHDRADAHHVFARRERRSLLPGSDQR